MNREVLLRSMLFVPTYMKKYIDKAIKTDADALILDLEDAVPFSHKQTARENVKEYLESGRLKYLQVYVRLNPIESNLLFKDFEYVLHQDIDGFVLPKIYTADDMIYFDKLITQLEIEKGLPERHFSFLPLIETTSAVMDVYNIAKATKRNIGLGFGGEDFLNDLEGLHGEPPVSFNYPRAAIALAARAAGICPIDTPYLAVKDVEGFIQEEKESFAMGYGGCFVIHPEQLPYAHLCFTPTEEEVERSQQIIEALDEATRKGLGVAMLGKKMIGPPMEKRAKKVMQMIRLIQKKKLLLEVATTKTDESFSSQD